VYNSIVLVFINNILSKRNNIKLSAKERMWKFHLDNKHVYEEFEKLALQLIEKGAKRLSSKMIIEYLRASHYIKTLSTDGYKINNDYTASYARYFEYMHPEYKNYFETRSVKSEKS